MNNSKMMSRGKIRTDKFLSENTILCWFTDSWLKELEPYVILRGYRGSVAHNTYEDSVTNDDVDVIGVFIPPPDYLFGIKNVETIVREIPEKTKDKEILWDIVYYSLPKFMRLVVKQNPSILSLLWLEEEFYITKTKFGEELIKNRSRLLSKNCYDSYRGYAWSQFKRMTRYSTGKMGAKRKMLVEKFGYDVKNASHLIRLLRQGIEVVSTGEIKVCRDDRELLLEIKKGKWPLKKVLDETRRLLEELDEAYEKTPLSSRLNVEYINYLCVNIIKNFYKIGE